MPIHRDEDQSILMPVKRKDLLEVLAELQPLAEEDRFPEIDDTLLPERRGRQPTFPVDTSR